MNRQTEREISRLNRLADYIEANPNEYDQTVPWGCIVGLGKKVYKGKGEYSYATWGDFSRYFGVTKEQASNIFGASFRSVVKGFRNGAWNATPKYAAKFVRALAQQKAGQ